MYATITNFKQSASNTYVQAGGKVFKRKRDKIFYRKAAAVCIFILLLLRGIFELSYLFLVATCLTAPMLIAVELVFLFKKIIKDGYKNSK